MKEIAKALVASAVAFIGGAATAAVDDTITTGEWWTIVAAAATAFAGTWLVPNKQPEGDDIADAEGGA